MCFSLGLLIFFKVGHFQKGARTGKLGSGECQGDADSCMSGYETVLVLRLSEFLKSPS